MPITTTPSGGPQGEFSTYTPIYAQTLSSATASVTFSNIPTTYTDLVLVFQGTVATNGQSIIVRFNSDSGSNYSRTHLRGASTSPESVRVSSTTASWLSYGAGVSSTAQCGGTMTIQNYANTTTYKPVLTKFSNVSGSAGAGIEYGINGWMSTSAITSLTIAAQSGNMNSGCMFTLYGIKAATPAPKATGGDITTDGTYWYHAFKYSGSFVPSQALTCDYLVIAGGGAGGNNKGGGGGAGGLVYVTSQSLTTSTVYPVTVGAGGSAGYSGSDSVFRSTTAVGGGYGGTYSGTVSARKNGGAGGSGGGGSAGDSSPNPTGGAATSGQGNAGGSGIYSTSGVNTNNAGGGGGFASAGANGVTGQSGAGGAGTNTYSSWASATGTGSSGYYCGGGGGGSWGNSPGAGGAGGGGAGSTGSTTYSAAINTGSGGGGTGQAGAPGGSGASGLVIVRYAV